MRKSQKKLWKMFAKCSQISAQKLKKPCGDRDLTYEVKKCTRGRFVLFTLKLNPDKIQEIDKSFKITANLLKYLFVKLEEK